MGIGDDLYKSLFPHAVLPSVPHARREPEQSNGTTPPLHPQTGPRIGAPQEASEDQYEQGQIGRAVDAARMIEQLAAMNAKLDEQLAGEREKLNRQAPLYRVVSIQTQIRPHRITGNRPFNRILVDHVRLIIVRFPGMQPFNRTLVPGWNVLDYPEGTELYQADGASAFSAGFLASYYPLDQLDPNIPSGYVGTSGAPATTNAGADTSVPFDNPVAHWLIQNNTAAAVGFELDQAATAGSIQIPANGTFTSDIPVSVIHLFTAAGQPINGAAGSNIVVKGWA